MRTALKWSQNTWKGFAHKPLPLNVRWDIDHVLLSGGLSTVVLWTVKIKGHSKMRRVNRESSVRTTHRRRAFGNRVEIPPTASHGLLHQLSRWLLSDHHAGCGGSGLAWLHVVLRPVGWTARSSTPTDRCLNTWDVCGVRLCVKTGTLWFRQSSG